MCTGMGACELGTQRREEVEGERIGGPVMEESAFPADPGQLGPPTPPAMRQETGRAEPNPRGEEERKLVKAINRGEPDEP